MRPGVSAAAALVMDFSGKVLWQRHARRRMAPASTTKVLTAVLALELGRLDDLVVVSRRAATGRGSRLGLRERDRYRLKDLLVGMLMRSGNDAAVAVAEHIAGTVEGFVRLMNEKAAGLGAKDTHFVTPHGLDRPGHYTTAADMALMANHAMANPVFAEIVGSRERVVGPEGGHGRKRLLRNTNRLLWRYAWADGVKTGTTPRAGRCLVASATRDGHRLIAVAFRSANRWQDAVRLLNYGFARTRDQCSRGTPHPG
ncbi:MAG: D-alanyl-D-alanine carboxypeptidase family protein [Bacillota bacterium]